MDNEEKVIYTGDRGDKFVNMLTGLLRRGKLKDQYISQILANGLEVYDQAFTHPTANAENNYEHLELLGDSIVNCCIVWYLNRRFPQLNCPKGVKVIARLKINLVSKKTFADFGKNLDFWNFVTADEDTRNTKMKKTLEDVFEAFFGATQKLIDSEIRMGAGYAICYNIIASLFDDLPISLKYEDLYDAKTRLKEVFDAFKDSGIGKLQYSSERIDRHTYVTVSRVYVNQNSGRKVKTILGKGSAALKADAEQKAAKNAITKLTSEGEFIKPVPEFYKTLC